MNAGETTPPPLPSPTRVRWPGSNLRSLGFLLGLMVLARVAMHFQLPLPGCPMRELSGVPCPFCGSTRAFAALAGFDLLGAVKLNPFVTLAHKRKAGTHAKPHKAVRKQAKQRGYDEIGQSYRTFNPAF